ncbi:MAG TPA: zinc ribbon domain-containing protein [Phycisphaerae bacterium]|nr:zinc ribbon domain-containing protein [Phycisphaerae bacterium]HDZ43247.1 zinc ribbon domain-containing protein [Phycisphaerae bacterium]
MPVYEFHCESCGKQFELLVRSSRERASCEHCGSRKLRRLLSTFAARVGGASSAQPGCPAAMRGECAGGSCPMA